MYHSEKIRESIDRLRQAEQRRKEVPSLTGKGSGKKPGYRQVLKHFREFWNLATDPEGLVSLTGRRIA